MRAPVVIVADSGDLAVYLGEGVAEQFVSVNLVLLRGTIDYPVEDFPEPVVFQQVV